MDYHELATWLVENGGPVIRYRADMELLSKPESVDVEKLRKGLLESRLVKLWLPRLVPDMTAGGLHGSKNTAYENVMGKLTQIGCRAGMPPFDERTLPFRHWLQEQVERPKEGLGWSFYQIQVATFLAMAGYAEDEAVKMVLMRRLETLYEFTRMGVYDIYIDQDTYPGFPKAFRKRPLINPEFNWKLPLIYDIYGLASSSAQQDERLAEKTSTVVSYVLHPDYQRLAPAYGIIYVPKRHFYSLGWDVKLPGYFGFDASDRASGYLFGKYREEGFFVQRIALMAHFPAARKHQWFKGSLKHLEGYRTERGTYLFPRRYLQERSGGYWVLGAYMGLEESRRPESAVELESTFWMLKIKKTMEQV